MKSIDLYPAEIQRFTSIVQLAEKIFIFKNVSQTFLLYCDSQFYNIRPEQGWVRLLVPHGGDVKFYFARLSSLFSSQLSRLPMVRMVNLFNEMMKTERRVNETRGISSWESDVLYLCVCNMMMLSLKHFLYMQHRTFVLQTGGFISFPPISARDKIWLYVFFEISLLSNRPHWPPF